MSFPGDICGLQTSYSTSLPSSSFLLHPPAFVTETTLTDLEIVHPECPAYEIPDCDYHVCGMPPMYCHLPPEPPLIYARFAISLHEA